MLDDGYEKDAIAQELLVIGAQKAFVLQQLGQTELAIECYNSLLSQNLDPVIEAIATSNLMSITQDCDLAKLSSAMDLINTPIIKAKLNSSQIMLVNRNHLFLSRLKEEGSRAQVEAGPSSAVIRSSEKNVRKRKKKSKPVPKNADLERGPDPDRWKPKSRTGKDTNISQGGSKVAGGGLGSTGSSNILK